MSDLVEMLLQMMPLLFLAGGVGVFVYLASAPWTDGHDATTEPPERV